LERVEVLLPPVKFTEPLMARVPVLT